MLIQYTITKTEYDEILKMKQDNSILLKQLIETTEKLFKYELKEWENKKPQDKQREFKENTCKCCRWFCEGLSDDMCKLSSEIGKPILKDKIHINYRSCNEFEWN